ncbi:MAG: NUDIX hydrolase [Erysipelotrichia bacterium]|nr:NUDIX hydrolase [Erysipelotrichia bacterium]
MRKDLINEINSYKPFNEQEEKDKETILHFLLTDEDIFNRSQLAAHMTASAWVVNDTYDKAIMAYHNLYKSYSWLGGHADGDDDLLRVAIKEVQEECGVKKVRPISKNIFSLEVLPVEGHIKRGIYVPAHLHLNVTYLLQADEKELLHIKADENSAVDWFYLDEAVEKSNEEFLRQFIYSKLNSKLRKEFL